MDYVIIQLGIAPSGRGKWTSIPGDEVVIDIVDRSLMLEIRAINDDIEQPRYIRVVRGINHKAVVEADEGVRWAFSRLGAERAEIVGDVSVWEAFEQEIAR